MELIAEPSAGLIDTLPTLRALNAPDRAEVALTVETTDAAGHRWRSATTLGDGDPSEPWWAMEFVSEGVAPVNFVAPPDRLDFELRAEADGQTATARVTRIWATGPAPETLAGDGFRLTHFAAQGDEPKRAVLLIPGTTGSAPLLPRAALLASRGHAVGVLSYMDEPGLPDSLREIPLETLAAGYRAFASRSGAGARGIVVLAVSVGTGGALSMLTSFEDLDPVGVIAIAPTDVVWQALSDSGPPPKASSWTLAGEPLPWVPMHGERIISEVVRHAISKRFHRHPIPQALHLRPAYEAGLADRAAVEAAAIAVERIRCPLLLISGGGDQMWPAAEMAAAIVARRGREDDRHLSFADAGHFLGPPFTPTTVAWNDSLVSGGTAAGIAEAQAASWIAILAFLERATDR